MSHITNHTHDHIESNKPTGIIDIIRIEIGGLGLIYMIDKGYRHQACQHGFI